MYIGILLDHKEWNFSVAGKWRNFRTPS
jgi:hypothetical protein